MGTTDEPGAPAEAPAWAEMGEARRAHVRGVVEVLDRWATRLGVDERERADWRTAGLLHDVLRDADPKRLRGELPEPYGRLPDSILHGPAAAQRFEREGMPDRVARAIRYHTTGHPSFGRLGEALYMADFLEPGRPDPVGVRARLRDRLPERWDETLAEVVAKRLSHQVKSGRPVIRWSWAWWNRLAGAGEDGWAG